MFEMTDLPTATDPLPQVVGFLVFRLLLCVAFKLLRYMR